MRPAPVEPPSECNSATPIRILHIDDDPQYTRLIKAELEPHGIIIDSLNDERLWKERLIEGSYRMVLLDIEMPYISGNQLLRSIKKHDGAIQVIMLTGYVRMFVVLDSLRDGAEYCFFKPLPSIEPLLEAIRATAKRIEHWRQAIGALRRSLLPGSPEQKRAQAADLTSLSINA